ncbi:MAG: mobile mystery protein B [Acidimicrobiales bacterium]
MAKLAGIGPEPEGATPLEPDELGGLRLSYVSSRAQLDAAEFDNMASAANWIRNEARRGFDEVLTVRFLSALHKRSFGQVWNWAGSWRRRETNIGVLAHQIPTETATALEDARYWHQHETYTVDLIAVRVHHRLVEIHPFPNGNGRTARSLADIYLSAAGQTSFTWGQDALTSSNLVRKTYIAALQTADRTKNYQPLLEFARS